MMIELAKSVAELTKMVQILSRDLNAARCENAILTKAVAHVIGREAVQHKNPTQRLEAILSPLEGYADLFAPDTTSDEAYAAVFRDSGISPPEPTQEEKDQAREHAAISEAYRSMRTALRDEAIKVIKGASRS